MEIRILLIVCIVGFFTHNNGQINDKCDSSPTGLHDQRVYLWPAFYSLFIANDANAG